MSIAAIALIIGQLLALANFVWSAFAGRRAEANPWGATTLEWTLPSPPPHGNFGAAPTVHRWPYEYSPDGGDADFASQDTPGDEVAVTA
jgi:cytochrome c oxidase subunit 1